VDQILYSVRLPLPAAAQAAMTAAMKRVLAAAAVAVAQPTMYTTLITKVLILVSPTTVELEQRPLFKEITVAPQR
jgi:hypothetical protein